MENTDISPVPDNTTPLLYAYLTGKSYIDFESFRGDLKNLIEKHNIDGIIGIDSKILSESIDNFIRIILNTKRVVKQIQCKSPKEV